MGTGTQFDLPVDDHLCDRACRHVGRARGKEADQASDEGHRQRYAAGRAEKPPRTRSDQP
jgi:hypothetical protein